MKIFSCSVISYILAPLHSYFFAFWWPFSHFCCYFAVFILTFPILNRIMSRETAENCANGTRHNNKM